MPIGGFVITADPEIKDQIGKELERMPQVEVHGTDDRGNIVAVLDTETTDEMNGRVRQIHAMGGVRSVGLVYIHAEDEMEKIASGELRPSFSMGRQHEKQQH